MPKLSKRVVHLSSAHPANDPRIFLKECRSIAQAGYDVHLVARADRYRFDQGVHIHPVRTHARRPMRMFFGALETFAKGLALQADLYVFHDVELLPWGLVLQALGRKVIYDIHEDVPRDLVGRDYLPVAKLRILSKVVEWLEDLASRHLSACVAATPLIGRRFKPTARQLAVVNNYPVPSEYSEWPQVDYHSRPYSVLYLGAISGERGIFENIQAMARLPESWGARFDLAGVFSSPEERVKAGGMEGWHKVTEHGQVDRRSVGALLTGARVGLVLFHPGPNHDAAQPNKLFEYMCAGLPVIASDFPLWREIVRDSGSGLLVDPRDPDAIARAIDWIFSHPEEAEEMGQRGRQAVRDLYNWVPEEKKLLDLYRNLLFP